MLLLLAPILNDGLRRMNKRQLLCTILFCAAFFMLPIKSVLGEAGKNFATFVFLYILGFYLRNHFDISISGWAYLGLYFVSGLLIFTETYVLSKYGYNTGTTTFSYNYDNILIIAAAVFLFLSFRSIHLQSRFVNWVAVSSFFVYILSENENVYGHPGLYDFLHVSEWPSWPYFIIRVLIASLCIFVLSIVIDKMRILLFKRVEDAIGRWIGVHLDERLIKLKKDDKSS